LAFEGAAGYSGSLFFWHWRFAREFGMRHGLTLLAGATLALSACGAKGGADATANADTGLTADSISANDVTAIDAVTGEAANMAADVDYSNMVDNSGNSANGAAIAPKPRAGAPAKPLKTAPKSARAPAPAAATEPAQPANATQ